MEDQYKLRKEYANNLFGEVDKILDYIKENEVRFFEKIDLEIEACIKFLNRMKHIPNNNAIDKSIKEKIFDLCTLKTYDLKTGSFQDLRGNIITINTKKGKPFKFVLHDYMPNIRKYKQWIKNNTNKILTKKDVLSLFLFIINCMDLDVKEYQEDIKKIYGEKILLSKKPRYLTILLPNALLISRLNEINKDDGVFYDLTGNKNSFVNVGFFIQPMIEQSELITEHHKKIYYKIISLMKDDHLL